MVTAISKMLLTLFNHVVKGYLVMYVWNWFVVPFLNVPNLPLSTAIVVLLTFSVIDVEFDTAVIGEDGELTPTSIEVDIINNLTYVAFVSIIGIIFYGLYSWVQ